MKKLLALVLSVIMVLSIMPMAYAGRVTYSPEIEEYIEDYIKGYAYFRNIYASREQKTEVENILKEPVDEALEIEPTYKNLINIEADGRLEQLNAFHEGLKKGIDELEKKIADGEIVIVVDIYEYFKLSFNLSAYYYDDEDKDESVDITESLKSEKYINAYAEFEIGMDMVSDITSFSYDDMSIYTQAYFDAAMAKITPFADLLFACLDGNHPYGEYISDNNATEEADGTKTATCEFCGATDTITDEGTKLPKEETLFYEMIFDLIKDFLKLILSIFA